MTPPTFQLMMAKICDLLNSKLMITMITSYSGEIMNMKIIIFNVFDFLPQSIERKIGEYTILGKSESSIITIEISHPSQSGKKKWVCSYYELIQHLKKRTIPVEYDPFFTSK